MADLPQDIITARARASDAASIAGGLGAQEYSIGDVLKKKVLEAYSDNKDIIGGLDTATSGYVSAPSVGREKFSGIFNPAQRESLVSQYTGNQALPMLSLSSILGQRFGRVEDLIGAGTRAYQAYTGAKQAEAGNLRNVYTDLLNEYTTQQNLDMQRKQLEASLAPKYEWIDLGNKKVLVDSQGNIIKTLNETGGDGGAYDLATALKLLGIGTNNQPERAPLDMALEDDGVQETTPTPAQSWTPQQGWPSPFTVLSSLTANKPAEQPKPTYPTQGWPKIPGY